MTRWSSNGLIRAIAPTSERMGWESDLHPGKFSTKGWKERKYLCPVGISLLQQKKDRERNREAWRQGRSQWTNGAACRVLARLNEYCRQYPETLYLLFLISLCLSLSKSLSILISSQWHLSSLSLCSKFFINSATNESREEIFKNRRSEKFNYLKVVLE